MNPDKISNEDYVVDNDEIMEDVTQEKNAENDKDQQEIEKMESLLQEMYETDFMSLQLEEKQTQLAGKRKKLHDETFMAFLAHAGDAKALMCLLKNFTTMDTQEILTKHECMFPVNKYENDYDKRVLAIQDLLKNRDNLNNVPFVKWLVKGCCTTKHMIHVLHFGHVPIVERLVEGLGAFNHMKLDRSVRETSCHVHGR